MAEHRDLDIDPLDLLPADAAIVASIDVRAIFGNAALADGAAALARALIPIDDDAGLEVSRDVDRLLFAEVRGGGTQASGGARDYVGVATGRFDPDKLAALASAGDGSPVAAEPYDGFSIHSIRSGSYAALSHRILLVGTDGGVRQAIDRVKAKAVDRAVKPWMAEMLATGGVQLAVGADLESESLPTGTVGPLDLAWLGGLRTARITGNLQGTGMNVAATLTYSDPSQAQQGAAGLHSMARWVAAVGPLMGGVKVQELQIEPAQRDVRCTFTLDEATLRTLAAIALRFLPAAER